MLRWGCYLRDDTLRMLCWGCCLQDFKSYFAAPVIAKGKHKALNLRLVGYMYSFCSGKEDTGLFCKASNSKEKDMEQNCFFWGGCLQDIGKHGTNCMPASRINKFLYQMNVMIQGCSEALQSWLLQRLQACNPSKTAGHYAPHYCVLVRVLLLCHTVPLVASFETHIWKNVELHHRTLSQESFFVLGAGRGIACNL